MTFNEDQDTVRDGLVRLVQPIMSAEFASEADQDAAVAEFEAAVPHPAALNLIFYPREHFGHEPTAEEVVERALSYRPIEL